MPKNRKKRKKRARAKEIAQEKIEKRRKKNKKPETPIQQKPASQEKNIRPVYTDVMQAVKELPLPAVCGPKKENGCTYYYDRSGPRPTIIFFYGEQYDSSKQRGKAVFHPENASWVLSKINSSSKLKKTKAGVVIAKIKFARENDNWQTILERRVVMKKEMDEIADVTALYHDDALIKKEEVLCSGESLPLVVQETAEQVVNIMTKEL